MVRVTSWMCRVPVIKFKKGGLAHGGVQPAAAAASPGSCPAAPPAAAAAQPAVSMSTIPDIDLPARYRRQPLSEEEINYINGGGEQPEPRSFKGEKKDPKMLGVIKIPKGVLVTTGKKGPEAINLNIVIQKQESGNFNKQ